MNIYGGSGYTTCTGVTESIGNGDPVWFWQYWPVGNGTDFYFGNGPLESGGGNGTWHNYSIVQVGNGVWGFILDGTHGWCGRCANGRVRQRGFRRR